MKQLQIKEQQGVVLFIALIVLVVMSMAGVAMNRSVEASLGIAGNLASRNSTLQGTDKAIAAAIAWIDNNRSVLNNPASVNSAVTGYYFTPLKQTGTDNMLAPSYWSSALSMPNGSNDPLWKDQRISLAYRIERMCEDATKSYQDTKCGLGVPPIEGSGNGLSAGAFQFQPPPPLVLRVTARALGPRNALSIVQVYYSVPM